MNPELLNIYLRAINDQLDKLKKSARWKLGHGIISRIEPLLGRNPKTLAIDHLEEIVRNLLDKEDNNLEEAHPNPDITHPLSAFSHKIQSCAFVVTDTNLKNATAGDVFTALELGHALNSNHNWEISYISSESVLESDSDILISLLFEFDIRTVKTSAIKIAWVRSYAEYWIMKPWFREFDIVLCSSSKIREFIEMTTGKPAYIFPIATNPTRFAEGEVKQKLLCDYCFTGHLWSEQRRIIDWLDPGSLPFTFKLYGNNWSSHESLSDYAYGKVEYSEIPDVYASTKLVIDDANNSTNKWESVNSRVFDVIGSGKMLISNGTAGIKKLFGENALTYNSHEELHSLINQLLKNPDTYAQLFDSLKEEVLLNHTYENRAHTLMNILELRLGKKLNIAIKIAVSEASDIEQWGDFHFSLSLKKSIEKWGHNVRIDIMPNWYDKTDDAVLVLRGLHRYNPRDTEINMLWLISHPENVTIEELKEYDRVFIASDEYTNRMNELHSLRAKTLYQATDPDLFYPDNSEDLPAHKFLYIANSRNTERTAAQFAMEKNIPLEVYGREWENQLPSSMILGEYIPNSLLRYYYSSAGTVIVDHWDDMKESGFISNKLFDALACGARVISDDVTGLSSVLNNAVDVYSTADEFKSLLLQDKSVESRLSASRNIRRNHSFDRRALSILSSILELSAEIEEKET